MNYIKKYSIYDPKKQSMSTISVNLYPNEILLYVSYDLIIKKSKKNLYIKRLKNNQFLPYQKIPLDRNILPIVLNMITKSRLNNGFTLKRF